MKKTLARLFLTLVLATAAIAARAVTDDEIYDKVRIQLANDRDVKGGAIQVKVTGGTVELTGNVRNDKQRARAEKLAKKVKGVKQVTNALKISPVG